MPLSGFLVDGLHPRPGLFVHDAELGQLDLDDRRLGRPHDAFPRRGALLPRTSAEGPAAGVLRVLEHRADSRHGPPIAPFSRILLSPAGRLDPFVVEGLGDVPIAPPGRSHPKDALNDRRLRRHHDRDFPLTVRRSRRRVPVGQGSRHPSDLRPVSETPARLVPQVFEVLFAQDGFHAVEEVAPVAQRVDAVGDSNEPHPRKSKPLPDGSGVLDVPREAREVFDDDDVELSGIHGRHERNQPRPLICGSAHAFVAIRVLEGESSAPCLHPLLQTRNLRGRACLRLLVRREAGVGADPQSREWPVHRRAHPIVP
ncbi:MAG: hypothetical protein OES69_02440 [Myxococcales bacterium]|nr:hypothetical protein [Myxococcales bacterium]MDH3842771.1 hypothetical protein [Myxococcales bacterium]